MKLNNYYYSDRTGNPIILEEDTNDFYLCGIVSGKPGFNDGDQICTSRIKEVKEGAAVTMSDSVYELREMNSDYAEMLEAKANNIPIIMNWNIEKQTLMNKVPDSIEEFKRTKTHIGFFLSGKDTEGNPIGGEIIGQEGNYITLLISDPENAFNLIETKVFVCWRNLSFDAKASIQLIGRVADLVYANFGDAFLLKCRPNIPA